MPRPLAALLAFACLLAAEPAFAQECRRTCRVDEARNPNTGCCIASRRQQTSSATGRLDANGTCRRTCLVDEVRNNQNGCCMAPSANRRRTTAAPSRQQHRPAQRPAAQRSAGSVKSRPASNGKAATRSAPKRTATKSSSTRSSSSGKDRSHGK